MSLQEDSVLAGGQLVHAAVEQPVAAVVLAKGSGILALGEHGAGDGEGHDADDR